MQTIELKNNCQEELYLARVACNEKSQWIILMGKVKHCHAVD